MRNIESDRQRVERIEAIGAQSGDLVWVMETMRWYMAEVEALRAENERLKGAEPDTSVKGPPFVELDLC